MRLFHIVDRGVWATAVGTGVYRPASLDDEGFVHFSFADQVAATAELIFRDVPDLIVVEFDSPRLAHEVRVEDSYGSGTEFPHVYGPIPVSAAVAVHDLVRDEDGRCRFTVPIHCAD